VAKKLGIDCAPAMIGWEFKQGGTFPLYDGSVVCSEFEDVLMDAWNIDVEERAKRGEERRLKKVTDNWAKLTRGLLIIQKVKNKYGMKK
jgi:xeroderma pigmentosum group C-complementing protein